MLLFLESFYGGSHRAFADGLIAASRSNYELATLPAERWRQRTRSAAFHFARAVEEPARFDAVIVTDLIDLADLRALWGDACPPLLLYMHESQASYPLPKGRSRESDSALRDIKNTLHADRVLFNSRYHRAQFLEVTRAVLADMEHLPSDATLAAIESKSGTVYPGIDPIERDQANRTATRNGLGVPNGVPLIVWNHRWEYDKQPERFFRALEEPAARGVPFRLCLLGENPQYRPKEFERARAALSAQIVHYGFEPDRRQYRRLLAAGDIVVSTAIQENFGIAVVEATSAGCTPLLPNRLSYPELIPAEFHATVLYNSQRELIDRLQALLQEGAALQEVRGEPAAAGAGGGAGGGAGDAADRKGGASARSGAAGVSGTPGTPGAAAHSGRGGSGGPPTEPPANDGAQADRPGAASPESLPAAMRRFAWPKVAAAFDEEVDALLRGR